MNSDLQNKLFEDFSKLMTDAAGVAQGASREVKSAMQHRMEQFMSEMDVVPREEFEILRDMVVKSQQEIEELKLQIIALEEQNK